MGRILFWVLCVISLMYQYGLRTAIPSVLNDVLLKHFSITAEELGFTIGSSYFTYMCMQMPVGFILDKFNYRIISILSCVFSSLAIILFIQTNVFYVAYVAQICLGFSAAFAFPMIVKVASECFSEKKMTQVTNIALCLSALGPIITSIVIAYFSETHSLSSVVTNIGVFGLFIAACLFISAYDHLKTRANFSNKDGISFKKNIKTLLCNKNFIFVCLYSMFFIGATAAFSDTWGVSFIREAYGVSRIDAVSCISVQFFGIAIGGAIFAYFVKIFRSFKKVMLFGAVAIVLLLATIIFVKVDFFVLKCLIFMLGFCGAAQCLTFPFALKLVTIKSDGFVTGVTNTITMFGSTVTISAVGFFIQLSKTIFNNTNLEYYSVADYRFGLSFLILSAVISVVMMLMVNETNLEKKDMQ